MLLDQPQNDLQLEMLYSLARCYFLLGDRKQVLDHAKLIKSGAEEHTATNKPLAMLYMFFSNRLATCANDLRVCLDGELNAPGPKKIKLREWDQQSGESATSSTKFRAL